MGDEDELPAWDDTEYDVASFEVPVAVCFQASGALLSPTSTVPEQAMTPAPASTPPIISPHQLGMIYLDHVKKFATPRAPLQSNCATQGPVKNTDSEQRRGVGHSSIGQRRGKVYEQIPYTKRMGAGGGPCAECGIWQPEEVYEKEHFWDHDGVNWRKKFNIGSEDDGSKDDAVAAAAESVNAIAPIAEPVFYCEDCWEDFDEMDDYDDDADYDGGENGEEGEGSGARRKHPPAASADSDSSDEEDPGTKIINLDKPFQNIDGMLFMQ